MHLGERILLRLLLVLLPHHLPPQAILSSPWHLETKAAAALTLHHPLHGRGKMLHLVGRLTHMLRSSPHGGRGGERLLVGGSHLLVPPNPPLLLLPRNL